MSTIAFTSDWHLGHANIQSYCPDRPGDTLAEMADIFIDNTLSVLGAGDALYILGDVVMGTRAENLKLLHRLRDAGIFLGLIAGNHDYCHPIGHKNHEKWTETYLETFHKVHLSKSFTSRGNTFLLNHFPVSLDHTELERYNKDLIDQHRPSLSGEQILLHGHLHASDWWTAPHEIHVGIDSDWTEFGVERFHPIPLEAINDLVARNLHVTGSNGAAAFL